MIRTKPFQALIIACCLLMFPCMHGMAETPAQWMQQGNEAYDQGDYSLALRLYHQVLEAGLEAPELFYNMGNAYFRKNELARAILFYERAAKRRPSEEHFRYNLELAYSLTTDRVEKVPPIFYLRWWNDFRQWMHPNAWALTALMMLALSFALLAGFVLFKRSFLKRLSLWLFVTLLLLCLLSLSASRGQYRAIYHSGEAIVMTPRLLVKSAPSESSPDLFVIHEGSKVEIRDVLGEWKEIGLPNGNIGWVKARHIERI